MKSQGESPDSFTRILYLESVAGVEKVLCPELNEVCVESYVGKVSVKQEAPKTRAQSIWGKKNMLLSLLLVTRGLGVER